MLLGGAFLVAAHSHHLWQFQLSLGLCVGTGIAFIGNVPNSILLGRWFGPRLPTAMAVVYSATGAGVLILLPASQILIDHIGWRDAYQVFGIASLLLLVPLLLLPWRLFSTGSPHLAKSAAADFVDEGWTLLSAMRHHAFWALFSTFFFTAIGMYAISPQVVAYLIDAGFPPLQAATAWGFSGIVLLFGMLGVSWLDGIIGRRPSVLFSYAVSILGIVMLWLLQWYPNFWLLIGLCRLFRQHDRLARTAIERNRHEDLSRQTDRHDLRRHFVRQRAGIGVRLLGRRPDPRLDPQLQSLDRVCAGQRGPGDDPVPGGAGAATLTHALPGPAAASHPCASRSSTFTFGKTVPDIFPATSLPGTENESA